MAGRDAHQWSADRADDLAALLDASLPGEGVTADELEGVCWDDPGVVLGTPDGAVAAVVREVGGVALGWIRLLVVHPGARRQGLGRSLVGAAEAWCAERGAVEVRFGGSAPFYLWPGIDLRWTAGLCLAEACDYRTEGVALNLSCPTTFRAPVPVGLEVRRLLEDAEAGAVRAWCADHYPHWEAEVTRAVDQGGAFGAFAEGDKVVGFACHSVNRARWVGPMATRATDGAHVAGTGAALVGELCRDLMVAGYADAEIAWVSNVSFYARTAGAAVSRSFLTVVKDLNSHPRSG